MKEEDIDIKEMYLYHLGLMNNESGIYTNNGLKHLLNEIYQCELEKKKEVIKKYKENFLLIKEKIDFLIQELIDKINTIPYALRCICKVISILMNIKFPLLPKFLRNSFIVKFLFDKCIFPILNLETNNSF